MSLSLFNQIEAALWFVLAFVTWGIWGTSSIRARWLSVALVAFAASDLVEVKTGAWWNPWWLLVCKGGCIAAMVWLALPLLRKKEK